MKIGLITLGCDKNTVDMEYVAGILEARGHTLAVEGEQDILDVLVILTCGFIEDARAESLQTIMAYCDTKERLGNPRHLIMAGCMAQRYGEEMRDHLPNVDAFAGVGRPEALANLIEHVGNEKTPTNAPLPAPVMRINHAIPRKRLDDSPSTFLKIADGCDHTCSFCSIPAIKGAYISVPREILLDEARALINSGAKELNLIAQDLAPYGRDLYDDYQLTNLLTDLCTLPGDFRIRLLYIYPAGLTDEFIDIFAREDKICKYIDIPLQHLDADVLRDMRRPRGQNRALNRIAELRRRVPDVVVRTTIIVGFPTETPKAYKNLIKGISDVRFERLGTFIYSPEEGTPAAEMPEQIPRKTAQRRLERLMKTQAEISLEIQKTLIGKTLSVLVEGLSEDGETIIGRSYRDAPDIDGCVAIRREDCEKPKQFDEASTGDFIQVKIIEADPYDLAGKIV